MDNKRQNTSAMKNSFETINSSPNHNSVYGVYGSSLSNGFAVPQDKDQLDQWPVHHLRETQDRAIAGLKEAVNILPEMERAALQEASFLCPNLVELESNSLTYLHCHGGNAFVAAHRQAAYWTQRKALLGNLAFLPLTAAHPVTQGSSEFVNEEVFSQLSKTDSAGRRFFFYKVLATNNLQTLDMRYVFLLLSTYAGRESFGLSNEIVLLVHVESTNSTVIDIRLQNLLSFAMPWKLHSIHIVYLLQPTFTLSSFAFDNLKLLPTLQQITRLHKPTTPYDLFQSLNSYDIPVECIPTVWGGTCSRSTTLEHFLNGKNSDKRKRHDSTTNGDVNKDVSKVQNLLVTRNGMTEVKQRDGILEEMQFAIENLPNDSKAAYFEAVKCAPELVHKESDPHYFLDRDEQDVWAAASRLAAYWKLRLELFADRAYLPLDLLDGSGALSFDDLEFMAKGVLVPMSHDALGRDLFCFDRSRFDGSSKDLQLRFLRSLFYWSLSTMKNTISRHKGIVAVSVIRVLGRDIDRLDAKPAMDLLHDALPIKVDCIHICLVDALKENLARLKQTVVPAIIVRLKSFRSIECHLHIDGTKIGDFDGLQLPQCAGGSWSYGTFDSWFTKKRAALTSNLIASRKVDKSTVHAARSASSSSSSFDSDGVEASIDTQSTAAIVVPDEDGNPTKTRRVNDKTKPFASIDQGSFQSKSTTQSEDHNFIETSAMQLEGIRRLEEAMDLLQEDEKEAYFAAKRCVPHLVQIESDPLRFIRFANYNAWSAARHLALYWKNRVAIFGRRAFFPLTLDGNGALSSDDITSYQSGYVAFLSNDQKGRTVICYDPQKRNNISREERLRIIFYVWSVICENEVSLTEGLILVIILPFSGATLDANAKECIDLVMQSFPTYLYNMHIVNFATGIAQRLFYEVILPFAYGMLEKFYRKKTIVHVGSIEELLSKLRRYGFAVADLPGSIGGSWTVQDHLMWMQERLQVETVKYNFNSVAIPENKNTLFASRIRIGLLGKVNGEVAVQPFPIADVSLSIGGNNFPRSLEVTNAGLQELTKAMEQISQDAKAAYLAALAQAPKIVYTESDPAAFLRHERFDTLAAARRLAKYWEVRASIFGSRKYLPLDQTGEGALDRRDLSVLGTAYLMCQGKDANGRTVMVCDGTRLSRSTRQSRLRTSFYMYSIAAESKLSQTNGFVLLYVMTDEPSFDRANKECLDLVLSAIPAYIQDVHLLRCIFDASETSKMDPAILHQFRQIARNTIVSHVTGSKTSLAEKLRPFGLDAEDLPKSIGGKFGYDRFVQWQELRTRFEWDLPAGVSNKQAATMFDFSKVTPLSELSEADRHERKRRLNVIHSRRKRERERIEIEVLNEQCNEQQDRKKHLLREYNRLMTLFSKKDAILDAAFAN